MSQHGDFANFRLRAEAKVNLNGIGNVVFRTQQQQGRVGSYFVLLNCTNPNVPKTGGVMAFTGLRNPVTLVPLRTSPVEPNEWFTVEVVAEGPHITVYVNQVKTADFEDARYAGGGIKLWHGDPTVVQFRSIRIKELPASK